MNQQPSGGIKLRRRRVRNDIASMLLSALLLLFHLSHVYVVSGASCGCSQVVVPVHVDVLVPKDPADQFAGLKSNASELRRVNDTYEIYGVFCQPDNGSSKNKDLLQILVHGLTYTSQYWSPPVEEFRNYSYAAFSCDHGLSTFAIDALGVGLSSQPVNSSDVQLTTSSGALSQLARRLKSISILPGVPAFKKIIGIGHSAGSTVLNFDAIVEGTQSPFDGLILTAALTVDIDLALPVLTPGRDAEPLRWGSLDPGYLTATDRSGFYPLDNSTFSPRMVVLDGFTKDLGTVGIFGQVAATSSKTKYSGPVAKVVGSEGQVFCADGRCGDVPALTAAERTLWPDARSFEVVVEQGSGHDLNLDFFAKGPFNTFVRLVKQFTDL
ncbi:hypothetical protein C8R43DRAFT_132304 [Mycena crocata]|nr:hypothetical protein C8R43DRAFT_132304 [Mycena crocata]